MLGRIRNAGRGFTLIEIVAATAILSGALLAFIRIMADNIKVSREVELRTHSILLAEAEMERAKGALSNSSIGAGATDFDLGNNYRARRTVVDSTLWQIEMQVGYDTDGDSSLDTEESMVTITTFYGKR